ncbi:MAG: hypothetical protein ACXAB4_01020 [Candidatus Hodarchaeales archaeon]
MSEDHSSDLSSQQRELVSPFLISEDKNIKRANQEAIELVSVLYLASQAEPGLKTPLNLIARVYWPFWLAGLEKTLHLVDGLGNLVSSEVFPSLPYVNQVNTELGSPNSPKTIHEFRSQLENLRTWPLPSEDEASFVDFKIPSPGISRALSVFLADSQEQIISGYRLRPRITSYSALEISQGASKILTEGMVHQVQKAATLVNHEVEKWQKKGEELLDSLREQYRDRLGKLIGKSHERVRELDERKRNEIDEANKGLISPDIPTVPYNELQNLTKLIETHLQDFRKSDKIQDYELVLDNLINLVFEFHESSRELEFVLGEYLYSLLETKGFYSKSKQEALVKIEKIHAKYEKQISKYTRDEDLIKDDEAEKVRQGHQTLRDIEEISIAVLKRLEGYQRIERERAEQLREWYLIPRSRFPRDIRPSKGEVQLIYVPTYVVQWHRRVISPLIIYPTIIRKSKDVNLEFRRLEESEYVDLNPFFSHPRLRNNNLFWTQGDRILDLLEEGLDSFEKAFGNERIESLRTLAKASLEAFANERPGHENKQI